jgi:hypothetical protein
MLMCVRPVQVKSMLTYLLKAINPEVCVMCASLMLFCFANCPRGDRELLKVDVADGRSDVIGMRPTGRRCPRVSE